MSNALFPTLPGLRWDIEKNPEFNTIVQRSVSLAELRGSFTATPIYNFTLHYDVLRDDTLHNELKQLAGFFLARRGKWDSFLFLDPDDSAATLQAFGTGDGATTAFQLVRTFGSFTESVCNIGVSPAIYKAGVLQVGGYSVSATGLVTFSMAPTGGQALTWSGTYYFRCRFLEDTQQFNQFMRQLWDAKQVQFLASLGTKI